MLTSSDDVMQALKSAIFNWLVTISMVFYIWQPGGMADRSGIADGCRTSWHSLPFNARLHQSSVAFSVSRAGMMRNAGIEVVEALRSIYCAFSCAGWIFASTAR